MFGEWRIDPYFSRQDQHEEVSENCPPCAPYSPLGWDSDQRGEIELTLSMLTRPATNVNTAPIPRPI